MKNAFIKEVNERGMVNSVCKNKVIVDFGSIKELGLKNNVTVEVNFLKQEIMIIIKDIAKAKDRDEALDLMNQKNQEIMYGKYYIDDDDVIEYQSWKWRPISKKDPKCVFELIIKCLKEYAPAHKELIHC